MIKRFINKIVSMRFSDAKKGGWPGTPMGQPLKYRESTYTLAELPPSIVTGKRFIICFPR